MAQTASNCYVLFSSSSAQRKAGDILKEANIECSYVRVKSEKGSAKILLFTPAGTYEGLEGVRAYTIFTKEASSVR